MRARNLSLLERERRRSAGPKAPFLFDAAASIASKGNVNTEAKGNVESGPEISAPTRPGPARPGKEEKEATSLYALRDKLGPEGVLASGKRSGSLRFSGRTYGRAYCQKLGLLVRVGPQRSKVDWA